MESVVRCAAIDWIEARDLLRQWREQNLRKSSKAVQLGSFLLKHKKSALGNEVWSVYEQTYIAALDCGNLSLAEECLKSLKVQFPDSVKVNRIHGLCLETKEEYEDVKGLYEGILETRPTCTFTRKRKATILKAQGKIVEAIKELNEFLQTFMSDSEAWLELADLYIGINEYGRAAFCVEELILINPHHYLYHIKYAEICYTLGSTERMEIARKHYATAVKLNPVNLRALYGFYLACQWLGTKNKSDFKSKNHQCTEWAKIQVKKCYQFDDHKLRIVDRMFDKQ